MDNIETDIGYSRNEEDLQSVLVDPQKSIEKAEESLNFLAALCFSEHMKYLFPDMFLVVWELLKSKIHLFRDFSKLAIGIPRGFAKTTLIKLWIVYCILFTKKSFVLIVSYNEDHPESIISDVCTMLSAPNVKALFGDWQTNQEIDQQALKVFRFRGREIILKAVGAKGGIRGVNYKNRRPDIIIFEDYQKKAESEDEQLSLKLYKDMIGTVMKANSPFGCLYIYVANMYPTPGSILKKLKENPDWISLILGAIITNEETGEVESLWEELQPLEQLLEEYASDLRAGCPEVFLAEKLNDETAGIKAGIDITKIPRFPYDDDEQPQGRAVIIDPSLDNPTSDYNGIGLVGLYDGIPTLEKVKLKRYTPLQLIKKALIMAYKARCKLIVVENVAYQASLLFWFSKICEDNGIEGFIFMPLNVQTGKSKNAKIMSGLKELEKKEVFTKDDVRPLLINEIIKFNPLKKNNQDTCLDLLCFCKKVVEQYSELMLMEDELKLQINENAAPRTVEENCLF
jgi:hypothetical protein